MISLFQFVDPGTLAGMYAGIGAVYLLMDRRLRKVENQISELLGEIKGRNEVKK